MEPILLDPELLRKLYEARSRVLDHLNEVDADVFEDGKNFCCRSVDDHGREISGYGETPEMAIEEWHTGYQLAFSKVD